MGQYDDLVKRQRLLLDAEEWAKGVKCLHAHSLNSMWYDDRPQDTSNGKSVLDVEYNNGTIHRKLSNGKTYVFGKELTGDKLIDSYLRNN